MLATFPVPILSVTADAVRDLQGQDALYSLWTVFTKCKESVQDGRRLENISWRLWYRDLIQPQRTSRPATPLCLTPLPKNERCRPSYFVAPADEKASLRLEVLASGLPSPSDLASPSPLSPPLVPPPTPERPRISPHLSGSPTPPGSSLRGKSTPCVGRVIVDMLPNQITVPQRKPASAAATTASPSTPPTASHPPRSSDLNVPLVQLPASTEALFPRVVVVNPTPHPTPPTTPILHNDVPGAPQPPSTFLLPPLPPPALRPPPPSAEFKGHRPAQPSRSPEPSSSHAPVRIADDESSLRQSDRRFFLQQSPEYASPERGDGSTASGKSPSDLFEASSATSSQMKSVATDADGEMDKKECRDEEEEDRQSTTATGEADTKQTGHSRQNKPKRLKEVGKRPVVKRSHSAKHVAPSMVRKLSMQQQHPLPHAGRAEKKYAMFNFGSGSSNGSRSANGSTDKGNTKPSPVVNGFTSVPPAKVSPPRVHPPAIPSGLANGQSATSNLGPNGVAPTNGNAKADATVKVNGNATANTNTQSRKTIVVANSSSDFETTDGEDSEEWASEEMDAEDKARQAEETRLHEAALEAQRQRDMFAKVPKRSYSNLNRTQSGLLSQLMNPNPAIFPLNHPYRISRSSADISRHCQPQHAPVPQRSTSAYAPPRLSTSKSAAALPMAAQITAVSSSKSQASSAAKRQESEKNGYRPKGPPQEQEMEDDSGDDADDKIQVSQSVAHQRLQALMSRRTSDRGTSSHLIQTVAMETGPGLLSSHTAPIPLGHPYNLPAAPAPMTPRTTRRRMLKTELSESMRRQLLWERQVSSNTNPALVARRATQGLNSVRPMTSTGNDGERDPSTRSAEAQDRDERRRRAMARNRSWADDYHYSGW